MKDDDDKDKKKGNEDKEKKKSSITERNEVTRARLDYLQQNSYFKEALVLMNHTKVTQGKETVLLHLGRVHEAVKFALSELSNVESLYELGIMLLDTHPYAAFEICAKAVGVLTSAAREGRSPFRDHDIYSRFSMFLPPFLLPMMSSMRMESEQIQFRVLDMLFLLVGAPTTKDKSSSSNKNNSISNGDIDDDIDGRGKGGAMRYMNLFFQQDRDGGDKDKNKDKDKTPRIKKDTTDG